MKFSSKVLIAPLLFGSLLTIGACNNAETKTDTKEVAEDHNEAKFDKADERDAQRVVDAYSSGLYEVRLADSVSKYAVSKEAKNLAVMLAGAHTKINADLKKLAEKKQITLPTDVTPEQARKIADVRDEKKKEIDKEYTSEMVRNHKESIEMFEKSANDCTDADIKSWFGNTLPELRKHLDMAMNSEQKIKERK
jgi:putative membrane protein